MAYYRSVICKNLSSICNTVWAEIYFAFLKGSSCKHNITISVMSITICDVLFRLIKDRWTNQYFWFCCPISPIFKHFWTAHNRKQFPCFMHALQNGEKKAVKIQTDPVNKFLSEIQGLFGRGKKINCKLNLFELREWLSLI